MMNVMKCYSCGSTMHEIQTVEFEPEFAEEEQAIEFNAEGIKTFSCPVCNAYTEHYEGDNSELDS